MNGAVRQASVALFAAGHTALEGAVMPPEPVLVLIQALTMPTKLHEVSAALSPHITPRCDPTLTVHGHLIALVQRAHATALMPKTQHKENNRARESRPRSECIGL